jgi:hypothetical protein
MYMTSGIVASSQNYQPRSLPSQHRQYSNGHPNKKRRSTTTTTKLSIQSHPPPLPTPTSAKHPPLIREHRPSDAATSDTNSNASPGPSDRSANLPTNPPIPPYTPPPNQTSLNPPTATTSGLSMPYSPNFSFSPLPQFASLAPSPVARAANLNGQDKSAIHFDPMLSMPTPYDQQATPGAGSTSGGSVHTDQDSKDPFLCLLEQLAENEVSRGGPSELDFFLGNQGGA